MLNEYAEKIMNDESIENRRMEYSYKYYWHSTFLINSLAEYIGIINLLNDCKDEEYLSNKEMNICYRGVANCSWELEPSVSFLKLFDYESELVDEFIRLRPEEFSSIRNDFELLAKMQHYGLPTRLVDFSYNPLVALYFACLESKVDTEDCKCDKGDGKKDGRVLAHLPVKQIINDQKVANIICSMHRHEYGSLLYKDVLEHEILFKENGIQIEDYINTVFRRDGGSVMLRPPYISEREKRQDSIFMVFANDMSGLENWLEPKSIDYEIINTLFKEDREDIFFQNKLKQISEIDIRLNYISFIVTSEKKSKILDELDRFGINEAFLFPELEYMAKRIKNKYLKFIPSVLIK